MFTSRDYLSHILYIKTIIMQEDRNTHDVTDAILCSDVTKTRLEPALGQA